MTVEVVGFTGTRSGMTLKQKAEVIRQLIRLRPKSSVHGDCIGADEEFDAICKELGITPHIRPCTYENMRAWCESEMLSTPKPPMARNRDIVTDSGALIGTPGNYKRQKRGSGTWATIGFGEKAGIEVVIIFPDGTVGVTPWVCPVCKTKNDHNECQGCGKPL